MRKVFVFFLSLTAFYACRNEQSSKVENETVDANSKEALRPQYHFTPNTGWMNDPNGLVYNNGVYHLFYQYYPHATVWGPMHWGHATSIDMAHWEHQPIALFPDENGLIFSGSAVVDKENTSGFGEDGVVPLVAIFTYHLMEGEKAGRDDFQTQGIAYSLDNGVSWTKYDGNPVLPNEGVRDLRDPKVFWHEDTKSWIMALVAGDHAKFYRSKNLKQWDNISDFGLGQGAHGGVWECPDLFPLQVEGTKEEKWVLIISIGGGGPNGGSGTQYFIGDFDGTTFTSEQEDYKWLDWGTDNYAGVTYNHAPDGERIFIGWMSNWQYALATPATTWRSAMTLPRKLKLKKHGDHYILNNYPLESIDLLSSPAINQNFELASGTAQSVELDGENQKKISFKASNIDFKVSLSNASGEKVSLIYDKASNLMMLDRTQSGATNFNYEFGNKLQYMIMGEIQEDFEVDIYLDRSSVETFINRGQYSMTQLVFPSQPYTNLSFENLSQNKITIQDFEVSQMKSVW